MKYSTEYKGCNIVLCKTYGVISKTYRKRRSGLDFESVPLGILTAEAPGCHSEVTFLWILHRTFLRSYAIVRLDRLENRSNLLEPVVSRSIPLYIPVVLHERRSYNAEIIALCYCGWVSSLSPAIFFFFFCLFFFFFFNLLSLVVQNKFCNLGIFEAICRDRCRRNAQMFQQETDVQ